LENRPPPGTLPGPEASEDIQDTESQSELFED
jgi:segregation and condensation protein B